MNQTYLDTARLLIQVAPLVFADDTFALKGGTAINLFMREGLDCNERRFLISLASGAPQWELLGISHVEHLPGMRWKLHNLEQLKKSNTKKFDEQVCALEKSLFNGC